MPAKVLQLRGMTISGFEREFSRQIGVGGTYRGEDQLRVYQNSPDQKKKEKVISTKAVPVETLMAATRGGCWVESLRSFL